MRILLITNYFPPDGGSGSRLTGEFAGYLDSCGYEVTVLAPRPSYHVAQSAQASPTAAHLNVIRFGAAVPAVVPHKLSRAVEHLIRPFAALARSGALGRPDVVYALSPPIGIAAAAAVLSRGLDCRLVLHVQDLFPFNAIDTGVLREGLVSRALEQFALVPAKAANLIVVHAPSAADYYAAQGLTAVHVPNWIDVSRFTGPRFRTRTHFFPHLADKIIILFPGVLGLAQGIAEAAALALAVRKHRDLHFVFAGDGIKRSWLQRFIREHSLANITIYPMVAQDRYPDLVRACDILLAFLSPTIRYPVNPSKLADGLAAAVPILAGVQNRDATRFVEESGGGLWARPQDTAALADHLVSLAQDAAMRGRIGRRGRRFARTHLDLPRTLAQLTDLL